MDQKLIEVRDRATAIPCVAILLRPETNAERFWLERGGYYPIQGGSVLLVPLLAVPALPGEPEACNRPDDWKGRTLRVAHEFIATHYADLEPGTVVDVAYLEGETPDPAESSIPLGYC